MVTVFNYHSAQNIVFMSYVKDTFRRKNKEEEYSLKQKITTVDEKCLRILRR